MFKVSIKFFYYPTQETITKTHIAGDDIISYIKSELDTLENDSNRRLSNISIIPYYERDGKAAIIK